MIVCEGERTEPNYFRAFRLQSDVKTVVIGKGYNTISLVDEAIKLREKDKKEQEPYQQVWCVFDRDSFSPQNFNEAIRLAKNKGIKVAYSNEAFEIWYLLHFHYHDAATSRARYKSMLTQRLKQLTENSKFKYEKNDPDMYDLLEHLQPDAIRNAERLLNVYTPHNPAMDNPCTTVHHLVKALNEFAV